MKLSKILFGGAVLALSLAFVGCATEEDENDMISFSGSKGSISYTNEGSENSRGFVTMKTKHKSSDCLIKVTNAKLVSSNSSPMGYIFGLTQDKTTKTYNFGVVGFSARGGTLNYYVDWCKNVNPATLSEGRDFLNMEGNNAGTPIVTTWTEINDIDIGNKSDFSVYLDLEAKDDGSYTLQLYKADKETKIGSETEISNTVTGFETLTQTDFGCYANVYAGGTLEGTWEFANTQGEGVPVEYVE